MRKTDNRYPFKLSVLAAALALIPLGAHAAGLGRLNVSSALGEPLRAEIEVTASREELSSLTARMASHDAFKNAGIEYTSSLSTVRFTVDKRPNGQVFVVATSDRPFNEPFVDMLVEMNWSSGRLVREYTFLLDPPEIMRRAEPAAPVAVPQVRKEAAVPPVAPSVPESAPGAAPRPQATAPVPAAAAPAPAKPADSGVERRVVKGDTLAKIASEVKPADVNLDQMLAALFLSNKEVFDGGNMNRLRAGKILRIPDNDAIVAVEPAEARKMVVAQAADFNAYRKKLAAAAAAESAKEEAAKQSVSGKVAPKVEEKAPAVAAGKDKLEVSRTEAGTGSKGAKAGKGATEEDRIAHDKELKEANERIAALEKNISDMKKLSEMKAATPPAEKPAKPAEAAKPAPGLAVPAKPVEPPKPAEAAKPVEAPKPTEAAKPAEAPKPAAPKPAAPKPATPKPATPKAAPKAPPAPPPSFMEEHPEIVFGGGAVIALLLGYLGYNAWRKKRAAAAEEPGSEAAASSVFGTTGGQTIDTGAALPTDFSQQPDTEGDEGVDPVAEADVYIAYGRDTQAEEILLEALKSDPTRAAIHMKLLEIYAARKDVASFESVARELYGLTGGAGADWERAQLLGRSIDPINPLYGGSAVAAAPAAEPEALDMTSTVVTSSSALRPAAAPAAAPMPAAEQAEAPASLDFDLDLGAPPEPEAPAPAAAAPTGEEAMSLDFDLGSPAPEAQASFAPAEPEVAPALDFELDTPPQAPAEQPAPAAAADAGALDFDFDLSEPAPAPQPAAELQMPSLDIPLGTEEPAKAADEAHAVEPEMPPLDLSGIDLDLDEAPAAKPAGLPPMPETTTIVDDPEVATKLELAQAYEEMGDKEGARELLNEVLNEGSPAQQEAARQKLAALG